MSDFVNLIARVLMSALFIVYGYFKFADVTTFTNLLGAKRFMEIFASGAPVPSWLGYTIAAVELIGGLAILIGIKTRCVAWGLSGYVLIATWLGHPFWLLEGALRGANQAHFYKNLVIVGGLLLLATIGGGRYSLDGQSTKA